METRVFTVTRTGLYVLRVLDIKRVPRIGETFRTENGASVKVLDVIGPVDEPFLVVKPQSSKAELKDVVKLIPVKRGRNIKGKNKRR